MNASNSAMRSFADEFSQKYQIKIRCDVSAKSYTTVAAGGNFAVLVEPQNQEELVSTINFIKEKNLQMQILGAGSNLLVSDAGIQSWVVKLGRGFRYCNAYESNSLSKKGGRLFSVGASMSLMSLSRDLSEQGFAGLEFAGGIPASFGGAIRMNAGAHTGQIWDVLREVSYIDNNGEVRSVKSDEVTFSYRKCSLDKNVIVVSAIIEVLKEDPLKVSEKRAECLAERKKRQPLTQPSFGSVFKNPAPDQTAGMLIEKAGLKGFKQGGAQISEMHANWIVNSERSASTDDIQALMALAQKEVQLQCGVTLEPEVAQWE